MSYIDPLASSDREEATCQIKVSVLLLKGLEPPDVHGFIVVDAAIHNALDLWSY